MRVLLRVEGEEPVRDYSGRLTKTLVYTIHRESRFIHGFRGILSPMHVSPPFTVRGGFRLGEYAGPFYTRRGEDGGRKLVPYRFNGRYIIHVGGLRQYVEGVEKVLSSYAVKGRELAFKFGDVIHFVEIEEVRDVTGEIVGKEVEGDTVVVYLKSPAVIFNVYAKTRMPKFSPTAVELLMTPFLFLQGNRAMDVKSLVNASNVLGYLVESMYSLHTLKPVLVPVRGKREAALSGRVKYMLDLPGDERRGELRRVIQRTLVLAELVGIGGSRMNGFGTTTFSAKG